MRLGYTIMTLIYTAKHAMETRQFSKPRKFKVQASISWQDNVTTFWDAQSVLLTDFMPHKATVTGLYYADLLHKLRAAIKDKRRGKLTKVGLPLLA